MTAKRLKAAIEKQGVMQMEVAKAIDISTFRLSRYVAGAEPPLAAKLAINAYFSKMIYKLDKKTVDHCLSIKGLLKCPHCGGKVSTRCKSCKKEN